MSSAGQKIIVVVNPTVPAWYLAATPIQIWLLVIRTLALLASIYYAAALRTSITLGKILHRKNHFNSNLVVSFEQPSFFEYSLHVLSGLPTTLLF
jgi:hypothetical protein